MFCLCYFQSVYIDVSLFFSPCRITFLLSAFDRHVFSIGLKLLLGAAKTPALRKKSLLDIKVLLSRTQPFTPCYCKIFYLTILYSLSLFILFRYSIFSPEVYIKLKNGGIHWNQMMTLLNRSATSYHFTIHTRVLQVMWLLITVEFRRNTVNSSWNLCHLSKAGLKTFNTTE